MYILQTLLCVYIAGKKISKECPHCWAFRRFCSSVWSWFKLLINYNMTNSRRVDMLVSYKKQLTPPSLGTLTVQSSVKHHAQDKATCMNSTIHFKHMLKMKSQAICLQTRMQVCITSGQALTASPTVQSCPALGYQQADEHCVLFLPKLQGMQSSETHTTSTPSIHSIWVTYFESYRPPEKQHLHAKQMPCTSDTEVMTPVCTFTLSYFKNKITWQSIPVHLYSGWFI